MSPSPTSSPDTARFITFEGGEGSGKTTQITLLAEHLQEQGIECLLTREPGGTAAAEAIRQLLVSGDAPLEPLTETLLFLAARHEHITHCIKPALAAGKTVLCDRFSDSTFVYQGIAKKLGVAFVQNLQEQAIGTIEPDLTLLLDMPADIGLARAKKRGAGEDRFEKLGLDFHEQVRRGFLELAAASPHRLHVIDATQRIEAVHRSVVAALLE